MNNKNLKQLAALLDKETIVRLKNSAKKAQKVENKWKNKLDKFYLEIEKEVVDYIKKYNRLPPASKIDFTEFYMEHFFETMKEGFESAETKEYTRKLPKKAKGTPQKLAKKKKKPRIPRNLGDLMEAWDTWRKKKKPLPRQKKFAEDIKKAYIKKIRSVWEKESKDFREGSAFDQRKAIKKIKEAGRTTASRARMIVQTETTSYYNDARKKIYDKSPDVTHYLYVAIRDFATTKWCKSRDKLIYKKDTKLLNDETPPNHWNCRSELLPLTPANPTHLRLIENKSRWRSNNNPEPLPASFRKKVA